MAQWQILNDDGEPHEVWDDGLTAKPGDPDFSTKKVKAKAKKRAFSYIGTPNWKPPETEEDDG